MPMLSFPNAFHGTWVNSPEQFQHKLRDVRAFIFDWDGVFNNGNKNIEGQSAYSETDSMGTNLMRFHHHLHHKQLPISAIISGEYNTLAYKWAKREHFHAVYSGIKHKETALMHLCEHHQLHPQQVAFVFDDVLDFSLAAKAGLRIMIRHAGNPLLMQFAQQEGLVDYITQLEGGSHAVREVSEVVMSASGDFNRSIRERMLYSADYLRFLHERNEVPTRFFSLEGDEMTEQKPLAP